MVCHNYPILPLYHESSHRLEEFHQLQELLKLRAMKKRKERPSKDCPKFNILAETIQRATGSVPDSMHVHSGSIEETEEPETSSHSPPVSMTTQPRPGVDGDIVEPGTPGVPRSSCLRR